jgi:hypothetical protein
LESPFCLSLESLCFFSSLSLLLSRLSFLLLTALRLFSRFSLFFSRPASPPQADVVDQRLFLPLLFEIIIQQIIE